jgi:hypothetical protein
MAITMSVGLVESGCVAPRATHHASIEPLLLLASLSHHIPPPRANYCTGLTLSTFLSRLLSSRHLYLSSEGQNNISVLNQCVHTNLFATNTPFLTLLLKLVLTLTALSTPSHRGKSKRNTSDGQLMATANGALGVMRAEHSANTARIFRAHC